MSLRRPLASAFGHFTFWTMKKRTVAFIDGFNLYHAIDDLGQPKYKRLDLWSLCETFAPQGHFDLQKVYYFSAIAKWQPPAATRHREYVKALKVRGVRPVLGKFKDKDRECRSCGATWVAHEEKETDVNIALYMLDGAYTNEYDQAILISGDSDLAPPVKMLRQRFPGKKVKVLTPPGRNHSFELRRALESYNHIKKIKPIHLERNLLPEHILSSDGTVIATRPQQYKP